jgi:hypothetical protein
MARKSRRRSQARRRTDSSPRPSAAQQAQAPPPPGTAPTARRVEMSLGGTAAASRPRSSRRGAGPLMQDADPGIPLEQVPYFTGDLARLGIVAALMVILLIGGAQILPRILH